MKYNTDFQVFWILLDSSYLPKVVNHITGLNITAGHWSFADQMQLMADHRSLL